jgi:hypothetical protein
MINFDIKSGLFERPIDYGAKIMHFIYITCNYKIVV